jgi:hypothetical protein
MNVYFCDLCKKRMGERALGKPRGYVIGRDWPRFTLCGSCGGLTLSVERLSEMWDQLFRGRRRKQRRDSLAGLRGFEPAEGDC